MWSIFFKTDLFMITTNPIIASHGGVVMGRGIAKEAKNRYPEMPELFAKQLTCHNTLGYDIPSTGLIGEFSGTKVAWFMVKDHWANEAKLAIITASVEDLKAIARFNNDWRIDLNFPGIGNGRLAREDVLPLLAELPDNVHVWEYGE